MENNNKRFLVGTFISTIIFLVYAFTSERTVVFGDSGEFITISFFIVAIAIILAFTLEWQIAVSFVIGSIFSLLAAFIGMSIAVQANVRTTNKHQWSI